MGETQVSDKPEDKNPESTDEANIAEQTRQIDTVVAIEKKLQAHIDEAELSAKKNADNSRIINRITQKLHQWIIFSVAAALLPIGINAYRDLVSSISMDYNLVSHGELVLVCAAISAEAIGDLVVSGNTKGTLNMYSLGTCLFVFFFSSAVFVLAESNPHRPDIIAISSLMMFIFTLLAGGSCKVLAEF